MRPLLEDVVRAAIRAELARSEMTQMQLAEILHERQWWVSRRLNGPTPMTLDDVDRIAYALQLPVSVFVEGVFRPAATERVA